MAAGGIFKLLANDGKADRMLNASELLLQRIKDITCARAKQGYQDPVPTLMDIERTHILYVNSHFKPFAAIAYEYQQTRYNSGTVKYNNSVVFSIPQFGDFFTDMAVEMVLAQTQATLGTVPALPEFIGADDQFYVDAAGALTPAPPVTPTYAKVSGVENLVTGVYTKYTTQYVDAAGTVLPVGSAARNFVHYCEYPALRLLKRVSFTVNNNPLDEYNSNASVFCNKYKVLPHKLTGWKRLIGQEVPVEAYSGLSSITGTSFYGNAITGLTDVAGDQVTGVPINSADTCRKYYQIVNGPQTPKLTQPQLQLWAPLCFWFNKDPRLAIPSVCIPFGQRFITIELERQENILFVAPGNVYLQVTVEQQRSLDIPGTGGTAAAIEVVDVKKWSTLQPVLLSDSVIDSTQEFQEFLLYINNIFLNSEIHDIYIHRIGFTLIRIHKQQSGTVNVAQGDIHLNQFKFPIETIYFGMKPVYNLSSANPNQYRDWHRFTLLTDNVIDVSAKSAVDIMTSDVVAFNAVSISHKTASSQYLSERVTYPTSTETIKDLQIKVHGIEIYAKFKSGFYRDYLAFTYGGINIVTPEDLGVVMFNFCLFPGTYQPSGHLNISRTREFYIYYNSDYITSSTPAEYQALGIALNFLLISDGSAVLRYST